MNGYRFFSPANIGNSLSLVVALYVKDIFRSYPPEYYLNFLYTVFLLSFVFLSRLKIFPYTDREQNYNWFVETMFSFYEFVFHQTGKKADPVIIKALKKEFPEHFIAPAVHLLRDLSLSGDPTVLGSGSDRTVLYSADLDAMDTAPLTPDTPARFKEKIQHLEGMKDVRIGDIKSGILPEWNILEEAHVTKGKVLGYNAEAAKERLDALRGRHIITEAEYKESIRLLKPKPSPLEFLIAQKAMRFGIVRWTPKDVKAGFV